MAKPTQYDDAGLDYTDLQPRDYSPYFLISNPFPAIPVAEEEPRVMIDRESLIAKIGEVTKDCFLTGKSQTLTIQGIYGNGKSHILKYVRSKINAQLAKNPQDKAIAAYVQSPGSSIRDLYSGIIEGLGRDLLEDLAYRIIVGSVGAQRLAEYFFDKSQKEAFKKATSQIEKDPTSLKRFFSRKSSYIRDVFREAYQSESKGLLFPDMLLALLSLTDDQISATAWRWILGEFLTKDEKNSIGIHQDISESDDVLKAFHSLKALFRRKSLKMICVLADELEKIAELHAFRKSRYYDDLRHLIDYNTEGLCLIFCVTPTGWSLIEQGGHPLVRRLAVNIEWLQSFDEQQSRRLIEGYLSLGREELVQSKSVAALEDVYKQIRQKHGVDHPELFPFTPESATAIHEVAQNGNISEILRLCRKLLDEGINRKIDFFEKREMIHEIIGVPSVTVG